MSFSRPLLLLVGCVYFSQVNADTSLNENSQNTLSLVIKPITCVVKSLGEACQMTANIAWQSPISQDLCLFQNELRLKCWEKQHTVSELIDVTLDKTMIFSLRDKNQRLLVEQTIKVHALSSSKYRRKLKSDWSLF